jgi:hypothetical protein
MPETTPITDLSTEIDRMLAAAQGFAEFAVEAQRIEAALAVPQGAGVSASTRCLRRCEGVSVRGFLDWHPVTRLRLSAS